MRNILFGIAFTGFILSGALVQAQVLEPFNPPASQAKTPAAIGADTTLKANVLWTQKSAKDESFSSVEPQIDSAHFPAKDPELDENLEARLEGRTTINDKVLAYFSNGDYCYYHIGKFESYCYHSDGNLYKISISNRPKGMRIYPIRDIDYSYPAGQMVRVGLLVAFGESYVFNANGHMDAHWIGPNALNESGQVIMTRQWVLPPDEKPDAALTPKP